MIPCCRPEKSAIFAPEQETSVGLASSDFNGNRRADFH